MWKSTSAPAYVKLPMAREVPVPAPNMTALNCWHVQPETPAGMSTSGVKEMMPEEETEAAYPPTAHAATQASTADLEIVELENCSTAVASGASTTVTVADAVEAAALLLHLAAGEGLADGEYAAATAVQPLLTGL